MPRPSRFQSRWLDVLFVNSDGQEDHWSDWLTHDPTNGAVTCSLCECSINVKHAGRHAVKCHAESRKHRRRIDARLSLSNWLLPTGTATEQAHSEQRSTPQELPSVDDFLTASTSDSSQPVEAKSRATAVIFSDVADFVNFIAERLTRLIDGAQDEKSAELHSALSCLRKFGTFATQLRASETRLRAEIERLRRISCSSNERPESPSLLTAIKIEPTDVETVSKEQEQEEGDGSETECNDERKKRRRLRSLDESADDSSDSSFALKQKRRKTASPAGNDTPSTSADKAEFIERLVELVEKNRAIFDTTHPSYKKRGARAAAFQRISEQLTVLGFQTTKQDCMLKWSCLRHDWARCRREKRVRSAAFNRLERFLKGVACEQRCAGTTHAEREAGIFFRKCLIELVKHHPNLYAVGTPAYEACRGDDRLAAFATIARELEAFSIYDKTAAECAEEWKRLRSQWMRDSSRKTKSSVYFAEMNAFLEGTGGRSRGSTKRLPFRCEICTARFRLKLRFWAHKQRKHNIEPPPEALVCETCGLQGVDLQEMVLHAETHDTSNQETFSCNECHTIHQSAGHLEHHLKDVHLQAPKQFLCECCGRGFYSKGRLNVHVKCAHVLLPTVKCPHCEMVFKTRPELKKHSRRVHLNLRPYECNLCGKASIQKAFKMNQKLRYHLYSHAGLKPFKCPLCPSAFANRSNTVLHIKRNCAPSREFLASGGDPNSLKPIATLPAESEWAQEAYAPSTSGGETVQKTPLPIRQNRPKATPKAGVLSAWS